MKLTLENFEGPLDLLLNLIKTNKMDIYNIDISFITEEYLSFINKEESIDAGSEYLVMASELIYLKSRMILKEDIEEDDSDEFTEEYLIKRLIEYEKIKNITDDFRDLRKEREKVYTKEAPLVSETNILDNSELDINKLEDAFLLFLKRQELFKPLEKRVTKKELSVTDKIEYIKTKLNKNKRVSFVNLFENNTKEELIVTFLSILELASKKEINIYQEDMFNNIFIERRE